MRNGYNIPEGLYYASTFSAIVLLIISLPFYTMSFSPSWLVDFCSLFDWAHLFSGILVILLFFFWMNNICEGKHKEVFTYTFLFIFGLSSSFILTRLTLGDSFASEFLQIRAPANKIEEPQLTLWIKHQLSGIFQFLGITLAESEYSAPSDYVFRQSILTLSGIFVLSNFYRNYVKSTLLKLIKVSFGAFLVNSLIYISISRVVRMHHNPIDVILSFALAVLFFWGFIFLVFTLKGRRVNYDLTSSFLLYYIALFLILVFIAANPGWLPIWVAFTLSLLLAFIISYKKGNIKTGDRFP